MRIPTIPRLALALMFALLPQRAMAQFTVYTDLASFLAATSNAGTDTFDDPSLTGPVVSPLNRSAGVFGYTATVNTLGFFGAGDGTDTWLSTDVSTDIVTFSGFGSGVRGIGGSFFGTDANGAFRAGANIRVTARTASGSASLSSLLSSFLGFVSSEDLLSLTVESVQPTDGTFAWPTVNDLVIANAPSVVPEPATWLLMVSGLGMLVLITTRRRTSRR
jgi:branched-subunit amino acid transport protein